MILKWNGWGYEGEGISPERVKKMMDILSGFLGISEKDYFEPVNLNYFKLPEPKINLENLNLNFSTERYERVLHSSGRSYKNLVRLKRGNIKTFPDAVVYPRSKEDIIRLLEFCDINNIACIPFGGGTSVVGGVDTYEIEKPVITIDMKKMADVVSADMKSKTARVMAGIRGPELEDKLRRFGLASRHYPQSFYFSTLGGWIAARSAGHFSSRYGKIEDMVQSIEVITPKGIISNHDFPSTACGPDIPRIFTGSEGIFGIITEATIICHLPPEKKLSTSFVFPSFEQAAECSRYIVQKGIFPPLMRILDEREYMLSSILSGGKIDSGSLFIVGFEADQENQDVVESEFQFVRKICERFGGKDEGKKKFEDWKKEYFEQPYLRDVLMDFCVIVDTLETATSWSNLMNLYTKVKESMEKAIFSESIGGVSCRITHIYESGASLYFTFFAKGKHGYEEEFWWKIKKAASDAISENGGTISHHHGVGRDHKIWAKKELKESLTLIKSIKNSLDPKNIMNPGNLVD
ncbi:MAG: FAD-binding oxidoreductase [Candidatus Calescibacterium sp.]|nr:FAD-binding oxidoreductase [Candidatus Calescibacterium sp.]MCX7733651.1 FAD-binding oxidoreductase [bacterium]MDW8087164.1 FAD-binding oxidoreductase [Candidatus Calescibacterium sp.]